MTPGGRSSPPDAEASSAPPADRLRALLDAGVVLSGTLDLNAALRRIVRIACRVVGARYGALGVLDERGEHLESFVYHGISKSDAQRIGDLPRGRGILGALIQDARPLRLQDLSADTRSVGFPAGHPPMRTFLGVPVITRDRVFGNLYLTEKRGAEAFTHVDEQVALLLAIQAGVVVDNARLFEQARRQAERADRRVRELTSTQEVGRALLAELDPARVLKLVAQRARAMAGADGAAIGLCTDGGEVRLEVVVGTGRREGLGLRVRLEGTAAGAALDRRTGLRLDDVGDDPSGAPIARVLRARSAMYAPLVDLDQAVGTLVVTHRRPGRFGDEDLTLLHAFADLASLALRNARLFTEQRERIRTEAELRAAEIQSAMRADLLRAVIRAQEDERARIARDLHDSTGQALASILIGLKVAEQGAGDDPTRERLAGLRAATAQAVSDMRRMAVELRPTVLDDLGLPAALERFAREFSERTRIPSSLDIDVGAGRLHPEVETVVYRVTQEALTNVAKHANASCVCVALTRRRGTVRLVVSDDGGGFDPDSQAGSGLGLAGMRERVGLVGGRITVSSRVGGGTTVELEVAGDAP